MSCILIGFIRLIFSGLLIESSAFVVSSHHRFELPYDLFSNVHPVFKIPNKFAKTRIAGRVDDHHVEP